MKYCRAATSSEEVQRRRSTLLSEVRSRFRGRAPLRAGGLRRRAKIDAEPDPDVGWQPRSRPMRRPVGGASPVDASRVVRRRWPVQRRLVIAAEEIQAVDPGFGMSILVNGLVSRRSGTTAPRTRNSGSSAARPATRATSSSSDAPRASLRAPGEIANFDAPAIGDVVRGSRRRSTATSVVDGRKHGCATSRLGQQGGEPQRRRLRNSSRGGTEACPRSLSSGGAGVTYAATSALVSGPLRTSRSSSTTRACRRKT